MLLVPIRHALRATLEGFLQRVKNGSDEWRKKTEDEDSEGLDYAFDEGFEAGDFLDDAANCADDFVAEDENGVDLLDGFGGVEVGHAF